MFRVLFLGRGPGHIWVYPWKIPNLNPNQCGTQFRDLSVMMGVRTAFCIGCSYFRNKDQSNDIAEKLWEWKKSSSSCRAGCTDIPDPLPPLFPIVHRLWQVFWATSVSSHSCWIYVRAGRPAFARPYVGVHKSTSLMSSSLLLQQCPACLVRLTWIVFVRVNKINKNEFFKMQNFSEDPERKWGDACTKKRNRPCEKERFALT